MRICICIAFSLSPRTCGTWGASLQYVLWFAKGFVCSETTHAGAKAWWARTVGRWASECSPDATRTTREGSLFGAGQRGQEYFPSCSDVVSTKSRGANRCQMLVSASTELVPCWKALLFGALVSYLTSLNCLCPARCMLHSFLSPLHFVSVLHHFLVFPYLWIHPSTITIIVGMFTLPDNIYSSSTGQILVILCLFF